MADTKLKDIGRRMPYRVPQGFFDRQLESTMHRINARRRQRRVAIVSSIVAAAACLAVVFLTPVHSDMANGQSATGLSAGAVTETQTTASASVSRYDEVANAFSNLSSDDQQFLFELYSADYYGMSNILSNSTSLTQ